MNEETLKQIKEALSNIEIKMGETNIKINDILLAMKNSKMKLKTN